ncbi:taste receptor type 1 member 1-like [Rhinichthys klamathensis goyatoka]|uniref:taste receptor type 1 member 1-like n=1 Tax=Rhinichthys klamathensis goyatoka TaxID=3034132 RepID=UPI0024B4BC16|nr:taste receptor type 1 member 1-like [Rhinichthys klamathensis goyatoka]
MSLSSIYIFLVGFTNCFFFEVSCSKSDFSLDGDYLLGGLFTLHEIEQATPLLSPETTECFRHRPSKSGYQMLQVMRFAVEEINNSTTLLPNVSLGYDIFDYCSNTKNFHSVLSFISNNGSIKPKEKLNNHQPKVIALTGPFESTRAITIAELFTMDLIPMVNYGASSNALNNKLKYPAFVRTMPSNKNLIEMIIQIIQRFGWNWVAFLGSQGDYGSDGLKLFNTYISNTGICLGYQEILRLNANYILTLQKIEMLEINVIVVFALPQYASKIIKAAIANNIQDKVWIASQAWAMNQQLPREPGIGKIGTIIGITERLLTLPGFNEFVYKDRRSTVVTHNEESDIQSKTKTCNQVCDYCTSWTAEEIINENPTSSFAIYAAIYTIAHALHKVLQCDTNGCRKNTVVKPYMLVGEIKKLNFPLNGRQVKYDDNYDIPINYAVVLWHTDVNHPQFEMVGTYDTYPEMTLTINNSLLPWHNNGSVPFSNCSAECKEGFSRQPEGFHSCCFTCKKCLPNSYVDYSRDPYTCFPCAENEWSDEGSTTCKRRSVVYLQFTEIPSIAVMVSAICIIILLIAIFSLFYHNYNTPVVRSAGGSMCLLMLICLILSSISALFFFGKPTFAHCLLRKVIFTFFFTVCISCLTVRSFQIICVFKMAAQFPKVHSLWVKYNGQWLFIAFSSSIHLISCVIWMTVSPGKPIIDSWTFKDQIMLICEMGNSITLTIAVFIGWFLGFLCLLFSYMGRDLPKNYNEAKPITFSLILYYLSWIVYLTAYLSVKSKYVTLLNAIAQISSINGILFSYFIPKSYIIIFQPQKNTPAYFQTSIQNYTQTISRT